MVVNMSKKKYWNEKQLIVIHKQEIKRTTRPPLAAQPSSSNFCTLLDQHCETTRHPISLKASHPIECEKSPPSRQIGRFVGYSTPLTTPCYYATERTTPVQRSTERLRFHQDCLDRMDKEDEQLKEDREEDSRELNAALIKLLYTN
jgi:hypothetical protein